MFVNKQHLKNANYLRRIREKWLARNKEIRYLERTLTETRGYSSAQRHRADVAEKIMKSRVCNFVLEGERDQLFDEIIEQIKENLQVITEQTLNSGTYKIQIRMPELNVARYVHRTDFKEDLAGKVEESHQVRVINVEPRRPPHYTF